MGRTVSYAKVLMLGKTVLSVLRVLVLVFMCVCLCKRLVLGELCRILCGSEAFVFVCNTRFVEGLPA